MKICFNETLDSSSLEMDLELCEKYGYDYIEIRLSYLKDYLKEHSLKDIKEYFDTHHIKPYGYNSVENVNFCTEEEWEKVRELVLFACESSKVLGGKSIVIVPTCSEKMKEKPEREIFDDSVKVLRALSDMISDYEIKLAFEPIGHKEFAVRSLKQGWEIVKAVDRDNVGLTIDSFNLFAYNGFEDIEDLKLVPNEKILVFHINDAMDLPLDELNTVKHRLYPGDGIIPLKEMCGILKDKGYDEMASVELFGDWMYNVTPEDVIRDGYCKTKAIL